MTKALPPSGSARSPAKKDQRAKAHGSRKSLTYDHHKSRTNSSVARHFSVSDQCSQTKRLGVTSLLIGLILGVVAGLMIYNRVQASILLSADYTFCNQVGTETTCSSYVDNQMSVDKPIGRACKCRLNFTLENDLETGRVYIYYGLSNFYQNYRFLMHTRLYKQLSGDLDTRYLPQFCRTKENKTTLPCGQLANVLFDDEYTLAYASGSAFPLDKHNTVLEGSRGYLFKNPVNFNKSDYAPPPRWGKDLFSLDTGQQSNNGLENGPFIVWMTVSTFGDFRKLYATVELPTKQLRKGVYTLDIDYKYGVHLAGGEKTIRIETMGRIGPNNNGLIVALGCLSLIYICMFLFIALVVLRKWAYFVRVPGHVP
uniref:Cell cycle control protein 50A n=1 Tax=Aceria tosichella TaxID=561515 RepID=A0A6G1S7I1_9ACAR